MKIFTITCIVTFVFLAVFVTFGLKYTKSYYLEGDVIEVNTLISKTIQWQNVPLKQLETFNDRLSIQFNKYDISIVLTFLENYTPILILSRYTGTKFSQQDHEFAIKMFDTWAKENLKEYKIPNFGQS